MFLSKTEVRPRPERARSGRLPSRHPGRARDAHQAGRDSGCLDVFSQVMRPVPDNQQSISRNAEGGIAERRPMQAPASAAL